MTMAFPHFDKIESVLDICQVCVIVLKIRYQLLVDLLLRHMDLEQLN